MDREGTVRLVAAIVTGLPKLSGVAACRTHVDLFDPLPGRPTPDERQERLEAAARVCRGCAARPACPASLWTVDAASPLVGTRTDGQNVA